MVRFLRSEGLHETRAAHLETDRKIIVTYAVLVPKKVYDLIKPHSDCECLEKLPENKVNEIQDIKNFNKKDGVIDRRVVAMFPDEKEAVARAFTAFRNATAIPVEG